MLERLRQQLLVVRELPVDAACRQPDVVRGEHDLVLVHAELDRVAGLRDARKLRKRARRDDRFQLGDIARELGLLDG